MSRPFGHIDKPLSERFAAKWMHDNQTGCWLWTAALHRAGYGRIKVGKQMAKAHRVAWNLYRGDIPIGLCVLHQCDRRACVNPDHLRLGTQMENIRDCIQKGRQTKGEKQAGAILTDDLVRRIRILAGTRTNTELAEQFALSKSVVQKVVSRASWRHVE